MSKGFIKILLAGAVVLFCATPAWAAVELPPGQAWDLQYIKEIIDDVVTFIIYLAGIVMVVFFILSGFKWLQAGGNSTKQQAAKDMFKAAVIGSLIILGVGVIINTISGVFTGEFFGGGSGRGTPTVGNRVLGDSCTSSSQCVPGLICNGICYRSGGNNFGEKCESFSHCKSGLRCSPDKECI
ncbi:MAG: pilin [Candidatus Yanofskybacteria bacterium]|nr:pilin [Candidatus Yanofskybacteria bacterium]